MDNNILTATNVSKSFSDKCILDAVSLDIQNGEAFGLVGPNGAGKTTLIRIILSIIPPDSGSVRLNIDKQREIGYLPEDRGLFLDVNNRQLKQTALSLTEGEVEMVETIGKFTVAREAMLIAPTKSALEANPQTWQTNEDCDLRLDLETC